MTNRTNEPKKYELLSVDESGNEIRLYPDGSKRNQNGQMVEIPPFLPPVITSDNAHEFHKMRKAKILRAIEEKVMDVTRTNIPADAIGAIVAKRAEIAMKDETRTGNEAAKIVLQAIDAYQDKQTVQTNVQRNEYSIDSDTLDMLERIAKMKDSTDVLDVDGIDNS